MRLRGHPGIPRPRAARDCSEGLLPEYPISAAFEGQTWDGLTPDLDRLVPDARSTTRAAGATRGAWATVARVGAASLAVREQMNLAVMKIVAECGTAFAFPSMTVYIGRGEEQVVRAREIGARDVRCPRAVPRFPRRAR
ncbi:hypothetical protein [Jannaschia sp. W003]|uniref:hypothetical protein n=1 Tax=Jannaschia sp. W003 TaxID=2867012 RepID=UPI0021A78DDB|nr:hypothetical protein [Jannaschia sp. W003]UWQ23125.1 hypothetical protein K3554_16345 [Jannaschia sp. W003]